MFLGSLSIQIIAVFNNRIVAVTATFVGIVIAFLISRFIPFNEV